MLLSHVTIRNGPRENIRNVSGPLENLSYKHGYINAFTPILSDLLFITIPVFDSQFGRDLWQSFDSTKVFSSSDKFELTLHSLFAFHFLYLQVI